MSRIEQKKGDEASKQKLKAYIKQRGLGVKEGYAFLELSDLAEGDGSRLEAVGLLHAGDAGGRLPGDLLGSELLAGHLLGSRLAGGLLRTGHHQATQQ